MAVINRRYFQQKPPRGVQLNKSHPLARGLVGAWLFNEGTGELAFDYSGYKNDITLIGQLSNRLVPRPTDKGVALYSDVDVVGLDAGIGINVNEYNAFTAVTAFRMETVPNKSGSYDPWLFNAWANLRATDNSWVFAPYYSSGNSRLDLLTSSGNVRSTANLLENEWTLAACGWDGSNNWVRNVGKEVRQISSASKPVDHSTGGLYLNGGFASWRYSILGDHLYAYIYNRDLTDAELDWLYREPYAMFEHRQITASVGPIVGTAATDLSAYLKTINNEVSTLLRGFLYQEFTVDTDLSAYILRIQGIQTGLRSYIKTIDNEVASSLRGHIKKLDILESTTLSAYLTALSTETILTNLTSYLQGTAEEQTNLRSHLKTIDNERSSDLTAYLYFALEVDTTLRAFIKTIDNLTEPAYLRSYLQLSDQEISSLLTSYIIDNIEVQTNLSAFLAGAIGATADLSAYLSKIGVLQQTLLSGFLVESDRIPHVCVRASGREKFRSAGREKFKSSRDTCPNKRRIE